MKWLSHLLFLPTLWWNKLLCRLNPKRRWWDWVDEWVLLGALPSEEHVPDLAAQGIRAVVNTCEEYEGPLAAYRAAGIEQLWLPTVDYLPPKIKDVEAGVRFIQEQIRLGRKVYVHCKAGRGRSATIVLCYLISQGLPAEEAQALLLKKRPQVLPSIHRRAVIQEFASRQGRS